MKWARLEGFRNFEEGVELKIDFENRKFIFEYYFNHPMGGGGNAETFAFEEAASDRFLHLLGYYGRGGLDETFGAGAQAEFERILKMSRAEYDARDLENKHVLIDLAVNQ